MGLFTRRSPSTVDKAAAKAHTRGDQVYVRTVHAIPGRQGTDLGRTVSRIEAAGWKLEQQTEGSRSDRGFHQQYWTVTFRRA